MKFTFIALLMVFFVVCLFSLNLFVQTWPTLPQPDPSESRKSGLRDQFSEDSQYQIIDSDYKDNYSA